MKQSAKAKTLSFSYVGHLLDNHKDRKRIKNVNNFAKQKVTLDLRMTIFVGEDFFESCLVCSNCVRKIGV